jgi:hypothetical protein
LKRLELGARQQLGEPGQLVAPPRRRGAAHIDREVVQGSCQVLAMPVLTRAS